MTTDAYNEISPACPFSGPRRMGPRVRGGDG